MAATLPSSGDISTNSVSSAEVLSLAQIQQIQTGPGLPPNLLISSQPNQAVVSWGASSSSLLPSFHLQSRTNLMSGTWANVTNAPSVSGGVDTVALPATNGAAFFRLQGN